MLILKEGKDTMSSIAAESSSVHAGDGAPSGDNAVAGDNSVASHPDYSIGGVSVKSVSSSAMPSEISGLPSVVGRNEARDEANNLAVLPADSHIINGDSSEAAT
jgi:hypothetical protein